MLSVVKMKWIHPLFLFGTKQIQSNGLLDLCRKAAVAKNDKSQES